MNDRKILDIIITHYNEPWDVVEPCLMMLKLQKNVDFRTFRVILIHDGSDKFEQLKDVSFPFEFHEIALPHGGVSKVRNYGIDISDALWITFIDCDDCFTSVYALSFIIPSMDDDQFNMLWMKYHVTRDVNTEFVPPDTVNRLDWIFMAGKFYRIDFLNEHGMRFNEDLEFGEDSAFNNWVRLELGEEECGELLTPYPMYAWCRRKGSATTGYKNALRNAIHLLKRNLYVTDLYKQYGRDAAPLMMARTITDGYAGQMSRVLNNNKTVKKECLDILRKFYRENRLDIDRVTNSEWDYVLGASVDKIHHASKYIPDMTPFDEWFRKEIQEERDG